MKFIYSISRNNVIHFNVYRLFCIQIKLNMVQKIGNGQIFFFFLFYRISIMTLCDTVIRMYFMNKILYSEECEEFLCYSVPIFS